MKRTFLAQRNALFSRANLSWGVVALLFALSVLTVRMLFPNIFWQVFSPVFYTTDALAAVNHTFLSSFGDAAMLAKHSEQLEREKNALAAENQALTEKISALSALYRSQELADTVPSIVAGVVARPPVSAYDILVVAKGRSAGVSSGMEAFGAGGVPLGIVGAVSEDFAQIVLFSSPHMSTLGWVGAHNTPITIVGAGGGALEASIPRAAEIKVGDTVFVPGPGKLPIGVVARTDGDLSSPSVTLRITPALNLFSVTWVALHAVGQASFSSLLTATSTLP